LLEFQLTSTSIHTRTDVHEADDWCNFGITAQCFSKCWCISTII